MLPYSFLFLVKGKNKMATVRLNGGGDDRKDELVPVVQQDDIIVKKKSLGQKFADAFISGSANDIRSYVIGDVIIPGIKDTILNVMNIIFFGDTRSRRRTAQSENTAYRAFYQSEAYDDYGAPRRRDRRRDSRSRYDDDKIDYRCIIVRDRRDAENIVDKLKGRIEKYGEATKSDLFELVDLPSTHTDNNWGWVDPRDIGIRRVQTGYLIDVADAEYLD